VVQLTAQNLAFSPTALTVPAGEPFTIAFSNQDAGVQHNVQIFDNPDRSGTPIFDGDLVTGVAKANYPVQALDAGEYSFHCVVHPNMIGTIEAKPGEGGGGGGAPGGSVTVTAQNLAFDTKEIDLPPNAPSTITFNNKDAGVQHNIAIYKDDTLADALFQGELVTGPATATYQVPALPPGHFYFHCDVHPTMNGTVVVGGSGGGGPGGGTQSGATGPTVATGASGGSGTTGSVGSSGASGSSGSSGASGGGGTAQPSTIVAQNLAFDTDSIALPAGTSSTITFDNEDAGVQHNVAIYTDDSLSTNLFRGDLVTGPAKKEYTIPALEAGTYYFHCDVHPTMSGTVTVS